MCIYTHVCSYIYIHNILQVNSGIHGFLWSLFMHRHLEPIGPNYIWHKVFSMYYVVDPLSDVLGFAVYFFLHAQVIGLQTFKCTPMTNRMWHPVVLNVTILSLCKSGQIQTKLQLHGLEWYKAFLTCSCSIILIFLSGTSLVSAGPLYTVSVVFCVTPYIDGTWSPYWFSQEILIEHFVILVKCHIVVYNFSPSSLLHPSPHPLWYFETVSPFASFMCGPQPYLGLWGYHFLSLPLIKNGFIRQIQLLS